MLLVTGNMSYKSGEGLVLDFGGPSGSLYSLFYVGSFLSLLFAMGNFSISNGTMTPSPL